MRYRLIMGLIAMLVLVASQRSLASDRSNEDEALIERVKHLSARALDQTQANVSLGEWLSDVFGSKSVVQWSVDSCDLKPNYEKSSDEWPMCVKAHVQKPGVQGMRLHVLVGTFGHGELGRPRVHEQSFVWRRCSKCDWKSASQDCTIVGVKSLQEVRQALEILAGRSACD